MSSAPKHYPALDGLRGLAILLVIFYHNYDYLKPAAYGWLGVDLFFVLSGYLITSILLSSSGQKGILKNFYVRRALRIFPLYFLVVFAIIYLLPLLGYAAEVAYYRENQLFIWTFLQNWLYSFHFPETERILNHLWSIAVEEQFYLLWPLLIVGIRNRRYLIVCMLFILMLTMGARILLYIKNYSWINYTALFTFTRIDGLCIGSLVALLHVVSPKFITRYLALIISGVALLNFGFYFFRLNANSAYPYYSFIGYTTFTALFGVLVHEIIKGSTPLLNKVLSFSFLRLLGRISYGFYLFHWPLYLLLTSLWRDWFPIIQTVPGYERIISSTLSVIAAFGLSLLSYYTYETQFLKLKSRFR